MTEVEEALLECFLSGMSPKEGVTFLIEKGHTKEELETAALDLLKKLETQGI